MPRVRSAPTLAHWRDLAPKTLKDWAQTLFFALRGASIRFDPLAATGSSRKPRTGLKLPTRLLPRSRSRRALLAFKLLDEVARAVVAAAVLVTVGLRVQPQLVERLDLKDNAVSQKCSGQRLSPALLTRLQLARVVPLERLEQLRRQTRLVLSAAAVELEVQVAIRRLVRSLLGAVPTTLLTEGLHLLLLERQVLVEVKTKAETFWQLLVERAARLTLLATRALAGCLLLAATEHRAQPWARLVVQVAAVEAGLVEDNRRQTVMDLRRLTAARAAHLVPMDRLALKAAWLPTVAVVPVAAAAAAAVCLPPLVLKAGRAVPVAQDLMEC